MTIWIAMLKTQIIYVCWGLRLKSHSCKNIHIMCFLRNAITIAVLSKTRTQDVFYWGLRENTHKMCVYEDCDHDHSLHKHTFLCEDLDQDRSPNYNWEIRYFLRTGINITVLIKIENEGILWGLWRWSQSSENTHKMCVFMRTVIMITVVINTLFYMHV